MGSMQINDINTTDTQDCISVVTVAMKDDDNLAMPNGLSDIAKKAHAIIVDYLKEHGISYTGGCTAFYSPAYWSARGEDYGRGSELIVVYDGGDHRRAFSMDAAYDADCEAYAATGKRRSPYALYEGMQAKLLEAGLFFEEATGWYGAVYIA